VQPVLFSAAKSISFSPSAPSQLLLERAAAAFPGPAARSRPFDPACCVEKLPVRWLLRLIVWLQLLAGGRAGVGGTSSIVAGAFQSVEDGGKADLSEAEKVLISTI